MPLHQESCQYTAFMRNGRIYVYIRLPFGLKTAVASFTRFIDEILGPEVQEFTTVYIDDLLIGSPDLVTHLKHISRILRRLRDARVTGNLRKTKFIESEVTFLGHILSTEGITVDSGKYMKGLIVSATLARQKCLFFIIFIYIENCIRMPSEF